MKNMKIRTKLILGFAIPLLLTIINVLVGVLVTNYAVKTISRMNEEGAQQVASGLDQLVESISELNEAGAQGINDELKTITGISDAERDKLMQFVNTGKDNRIDTLKEYGEQLKVFVDTGKDNRIATLKQTMNISNLVSIVLLAVSVIITLSISTALIREIARSVKQLSDAAKDIALGRVEGIKLIKHGNDEFGELVDEYTIVIDNIKYQAKIAEEVSNGNLTINVVPKSPDDVLGNSLKKLVEDNLHALSNISDAGSQVTIGSAQVASASQALAQGSTEQASAIQQITASISEIAEKTKMNAEQANDTNRQMSEVIQNVEKGNSQMQDMMSAMQDINKSSESISKIIKVIDDIAFQTNILALNAAVEAARAGEAGKGFAVVAEEINTLASSTKKLVDDISSTMSNVTTRESQLLESFDEMNNLVDGNIENAKDTQKTIQNFNQIAQEVRNKTSLTVSHAQSAQREAESIQTELEKETAAFSDLEGALLNLKMQLSRRSVLFEDIKNILGQIPYVCEEYDGKDTIIEE